MATVLIAKCHHRVGEPASTQRPGILTRVGHAILEARQRKVDREIAEILARCGEMRPPKLEG
jgi:hypothetical protein